MSDERKSTDGRPYYCVICGCGFDEYIACEEPDCQLEREEAAKSRKIKRVKKS